MISKNYQGREQAYIKHTLLRNYLEKLFFIIGQHQKVMCYVDCFAGPWKVESDDLDDSSISISLNIMKQCKKHLARLSKNVHFRALFIENNKSAFNKLEKFLTKEEWKQIDTHALNGRFYDLRDAICSWCGNNSFAFFFIDPTGWKDVIEIDTLRPLLKRKNSEYLINFMFDFILRAHTQDSFSEHMKRIFGKIPDTSNMTPAEKEEKLISLYLDQLKKCQPAERKKPRAALVKVPYPYKDRTLYDLIYLTRHPLGIKVFMEISEKLDIVQKVIRAKVKQTRRIEKTKQFEIFDAQIASKDKESDLDVIKDYWLEQLSVEPKRFGIVQLADMLEETGWFPSDFQKAFKKLEKEGKVKNYDMNRRRPKNVVHFNANNNLGERLGRVET